MKNKTTSTNLVAPNRRAFLQGLGGLGAASLACATPALASPARYAHRFQLSATGTADDFSLIWPVPQIPPPPQGTIVRVAVKFPVGGHDILEFTSFLAAADAPDAPLFIITFVRQRIDRIAISAVPAPHFGLFGPVIDNPPLQNPNHSPFGDLTGRVSMTYAEFDAPGDHTTFTLLGGAAAGNHASAVRTATGSLHIRGPWQSF
jgi:hypothetical protein